MPNLDVVAVLTAKPGSEALVKQTLTELVTPTRGEAGCISYQLYESQADPLVFVTVETWESQADLDGHMETDHIKAAFSAAQDAFVSPPAVHPLKPVDV